jgi:hypothetical protein
MSRTPPESDRDGKGQPREAQSRKPYETPRLIDYGPVSKLTQSNGITVQDQGSHKQVCL